MIQMTNIMSTPTLRTRLYDKLMANVQASSKIVNYGFVGRFEVNSSFPNGSAFVSQMVGFGRIKEHLTGTVTTFRDGVICVINSQQDPGGQAVVIDPTKKAFRNKITIYIHNIAGYKNTIKFKLFSTFRYHVPGVHRWEDIDMILFYVSDCINRAFETIKFTIGQTSEGYRCMIKRGEANMGVTNIQLHDFMAFMVNTKRYSGSRFAYNPLYSRGLVQYETYEFSDILAQKYMSKYPYHRITITLHTSGAFSVKGVYDDNIQLGVWRNLVLSFVDFILA